MFVVLTKEADTRGFLARAMDRITGGNIVSQRETFLKNYYYHIVVRGDTVPWDKIARMTGRAGSRLVAPPDMEIPPRQGVGRFAPTVFQGRLTAIAAAQALGHSHQPGSSHTVGLVDEDGLWSWCCREVAPLCGAVRVYTRRPERYEAFGRQMMEEWGASVVLADTLADLESCDFVISPGVTGVFRLNLPVITVDRSGVQGRPTVNRLTLQLPPELASEIPQGVDPQDFIGAAYELGTKKFPLDFTISGCRVDGRKAQIEEVVKYR